MKQINLPGHAENLAYPFTAQNCDWSAADGSLRGFPSPVQQVAIAGQARGCFYYKDRWYIVAGDKLYSWISGTPVQLASGITGTDKAHFVPLANHLVVRVSNRIYTVVGNTATLISVLNAPSAPTTEKVYCEITLLSEGGTATYYSPPNVPGYGNNTFRITDDTSDPEPGAHYFMKPQLPSVYPNVIGGYMVCLAASTTHSAGPRGPFQVSYWRNVTTPATREEVPDSRLETPDFPNIGGWQRVVFPRGQAFSGTHGWRYWTAKAYAPIWHRSVLLLNTTEPTHYALTTVSGGVESQPIYFEVVDDTSFAQVRYFVRITNLPSGTWRLYRRDSAGVYRLVHEGTGNTYWDFKADSELGARLIVNNPPTDGAYAIEWNRRCVIAKGSKLYISDAGAFRFTDDSEIVDVQDEVIALAIVRGVLHYGTEQGWYALYGWGDTLTTARVHAEPPPVGFVGDALALRSGGVFLPGVGVDNLINKPLQKTIYGGARVVWVTTLNELYVRFPNGKWTVLSGEYMDAVLQGGFLWAYNSDEGALERFSGSPSTLLLEFTIPLEEPAQLYEARVEGAGTGTFEIRRRDNTWKNASGNLPLRHDRVEHPYYELRVRLTGTQIYRLLMELEPRLQKERR